MGRLATLSQEVFRVLGNCNDEVTINEKLELLEEFSARMKISGYPHKIAGKVVLNGLKCYFSKVDKAERTNQMFHRQESEGKFERKLGKLAAKSNWFRPERRKELVELQPETDNGLAAERGTLRPGS